MSGLAIALVLGSALLHASWNLLAKRAATGVGFLWLMAVLTVIVYGPLALALFVFTETRFSAVHFGLAVGSAALHVGYFGFLQRGYGVGDLSVVYPLARGSGPALATVLAIVLLGERPGPTALAGAALVVLGVIAISGGGARLDRAHRAAIGFGLLTGLFIGGYTVWDGFAVGHAGAPPLPYLAVSECFRALLLTPAALRNRSAVGITWHRYRREVIGVAVLSPFAYLLVLSALRFAPVSLVAPMREISILFGTLLGARFLAERGTRRRAVAALAMVAGVVLLTLG
jgi:drug/metabolite transporter (DMT)-like permease